MYCHLLTWCLGGALWLASAEFNMTGLLRAQLPTPAAAADASQPNPSPVPSQPSLNVWESLRSLTIADIVLWFRLHALPIVLILLIASLILWVANRLHHRLVRLLGSGAGRGSLVERENRSRTLVGVMHNALRTTVLAVATIMLLEEVGVPVGPLLGGVAVVGLAVAFGTQSLIKDYFTGFLVLLEQQYMIGDVVKIGAVTGQVESITLRLTVLRDVEGSVHFIPHGQITLVSNLTHGWSQVVFDLHVNSSEPVERIRDLFFELVNDLRSDRQFESMILNDAQMLGVDSIGDTTYTLKFSLRTQPLKRWEVKRELLRRIKDRIQKLQVKVTVPA